MEEGGAGKECREGKSVFFGCVIYCLILLFMYFLMHFVYMNYIGVGMWPNTNKESVYIDYTSTSLVCLQIIFLLEQ